MLKDELAPAVVKPVQKTVLRNMGAHTFGGSGKTGYMFLLEGAIVGRDTMFKSFTI